MAANQKAFDAGTVAARPRRRTPTRGDQGKLRWEKILTVSAQEFHNKGYHATSLQDIADRVGLLKGSLYYYISTKEDLLYEVIAHVHRETWDGLERVRAMEGDALQRIRALVIDHLTHNAANDLWMGVFFREFRWLSDDRRRAVNRQRDTYEHFLCALILCGQEQQLVRRELDARLAAIMVLGMLNWTSEWSGSRPPSAPATDHADFIVAALASRA
jgi:AcrR family transcriptional regulator